VAKSLQEQLKQAGLANQKQMVKARKAKNTKEKMQRNLLSRKPFKLRYSRLSN